MINITLLQGLCLLLPGKSVVSVIGKNHSSGLFLPRLSICDMFWIYLLNIIVANAGKCISLHIDI